MKNSYILLILIILSGCGQTPPKIDNRVKEQKRFLSKFIILNQKVNQSNNDIVKDERLDSAINSVKDFIRDTLNYQFNNWDAEVLTINNEPNGLSGVEVEYMIRFNLHADNKYPEYSSLILLDYISKSEHKRMDNIRSLSTGDKLKISGMFHHQKALSDIGAFSTSSSPIENPIISANITKIEGAGKKPI